MKTQLPNVLPLELSNAQNIDLKTFTFARIGLGKKGFGIPLGEVLALKAAHASARDAIFTPFQPEKIKEDLAKEKMECIEVQSALTDRMTYLQRPDLGRTLSNDSIEKLKTWKSKNSFHVDISLIVSDGLSPLAVNRHAAPLLKLLLTKLLQAEYSLAPITLLNQGRVATSDHIGELLDAKLSIILIGERPGLSSPDSIGAYLTFNPKVGLTDERRNCVSNIRPIGLPLEIAAEKLFYLINEALRKEISGVGLKDEFTSTYTLPGR